MVDSSTEKLLEVDVPTTVSLPEPQPPDVRVKEKFKIEENVEVIPMQEELEVRLEEGTFPVVINDWPYNVNMDSDMVGLHILVITRMS